MAKRRFRGVFGEGPEGGFEKIKGRSKPRDSQKARYLRWLNKQTKINVGLNNAVSGRMKRHRRPVNKGNGIGVKLYQKFFSFSAEELNGARILDAGSALAQFAEDAEKKGATVISMDPKYSHPEKAWLARNATKLVSGKVQRLPFSDGIFDMVFARRVVPDRVKGAEKYEAIKEMLRVTKENGWIGVGPFLEAVENKPDAIGNIKERLLGSGFRFQEMHVRAQVKNLGIQRQRYLKIWNTGDLKRFYWEQRA